jgi:hypothetical protein
MELKKAHLMRVRDGGVGQLTSSASSDGSRSKSSTCQKEVVTYRTHLHILNETQPAIVSHLAEHTLGS